MASGWARLPQEVRLQILQTLIQDGCSLAGLATVSREWQTELERYNFARIKVTPSRLVNLGSMIHRNRALVNYIWFCLELRTYDCTECAPSSRKLTYEEWEEACCISDANGYPMDTLFEALFSVLSMWEPNGNLVLDISIYSPSDSKHWFPYLTFMPDSGSDMQSGRVEQETSNTVYDDPRHGWISGFREIPPLRHAFGKIFHSIMDVGPFDSDQLELQWWDQLPSVPAVTTILLRQQNRRRWKQDSLAHMFARFPRLQEVHYEPWREWCGLQEVTDKSEYCFVCLSNLRFARIYRATSLLTIRVRYLGFEYLFESIPRFTKNLKRLIVFENFNQQYPPTMQLFQRGVNLTKCDTFRKPSPGVSRSVALASLDLEHLAASFIVDASHFFDIEPCCEWPNLSSIVLTSTLLTPDEDPIKIGSMLEAAAAAALKMPRLKTMEIWNGRQGLAAMFKFQVFHKREEATITWIGTWQLTMKPSLIKAWKTVTDQYDSFRLNLVRERLDQVAINSHGDAIHHLRLSGQVIRPVSLQQIQMEQKSLNGVPT
ncbi:hypothetical protein B0A52_09179 [Exophiala mesophila]|uniref:DUF6546 domain-containing protein n=1 Tax=Exophiala mesophila TaxID=212818 RepID=A0A438MWT4_EXOME|nr:hypothetical protein B0A52_09179 [Exophiala mesophila]